MHEIHHMIFPLRHISNLPSVNQKKDHESQKKAHHAGSEKVKKVCDCLVQIQITSNAHLIPCLY